jgi:hypothetical protein
VTAVASLPHPMNSVATMEDYAGRGQSAACTLVSAIAFGRCMPNKLMRAPCVNLIVKPIVRREWVLIGPRRLHAIRTLMNRVRQLQLIAVALVVGAATLRVTRVAPAAAESGASAEVIATLASRLIADAIPREYERSKDWGRTKRITTGLRSSGNFFDFDIHRRKTEVDHGVWKKYRVTLIEPDKNLVVNISNLRTIEPGRIGLTLTVSAKLHGWARAKVYDRGIHIIALEAELDTNVHLSI